MKENNKAFTMTEILAVVVIVGVLLLIAVPGVSKLMAQFRLNYYDSLEDTLTASAKDFYADNKIYRPDGILRSSYVNASTLIEKKYASELLDYKGKSCDLNDKESYVVVIYKGNDKYEYKSCIKCASDNFDNYDSKYCDKAWLTNDNLKYDFGETKDFYVYYGTPREEVRELLLRKLNIVKTNDLGEELDRAVVDNDDEGILPDNIDELDTTPILDSDGKKEIPLEYKMGDTVQQLKAIVYRHKAPIVTIKKISDNTDYKTNTWSNGVIITIEANDNFFELSNTQVGSFQWYVDGGWKDIKCEMSSASSCAITIKENVDTTYKFRIVTNEGNTSIETSEYQIKVDVDKPTVAISPNGGEPVVATGSTTGNVNFTLTTSDTGGSEIKSREYTVSTSNKTVPSTFTNFYIDTLSYNKNLSGGKYYVWSRVIDNAGNVSVDVWPSSIFHMKYEIKYNANGGSPTPSTQYKYHDEDLTLSSGTPTRIGYNFTGWLSSSSSLYSSGSKYKENESTTLTAKWELKTIKVEFDANGGDISTESKTVTYSKTYGTLPTPQKTNYTFNGWYTSESNNNGTGTKVTSTTTVSNDKNHTLYANWSRTTCTVNLSANGGTVSQSSVTVNAGSTYANLPTPTRTGYIFNGWYTASSGGSKVTSSTTVSDSCNISTLYAQWTKNVQYCTVTFNPNGGTISTTTKSVECGTAVGTLPTAEKTGYTFTKWATSASGSAYTSSSVISSNITLNAYYNINYYTITYNANGGTVSPTSRRVSYGTTVTLPTPTRTATGADSYTFNGWYTASSGGGLVGVAGSSYKVTFDITVYAQWTPNTHTHSYEARTRHQYTSWGGATYTVSYIRLNFYSTGNTSTTDYKWCSGSSDSIYNCIPSYYLNQGSSTIVPMYKRTCSICGEVLNTWCPVHASGGSATTGGGGWEKPICDNVTQSYSSDATSCIGKSEGWTLVAKLKPSTISAYTTSESMETNEPIAKGLYETPSFIDSNVANKNNKPNNITRVEYTLDEKSIFKTYFSVTNKRNFKRNT